MDGAHGIDGNMIEHLDEAKRFIGTLSAAQDRHNWLNAEELYAELERSPGEGVEGELGERVRRLGAMHTALAIYALYNTPLMTDGMSLVISRHFNDIKRELFAERRLQARAIRQLMDSRREP